MPEKETLFQSASLQNAPQYYAALHEEPISCYNMATLPDYLTGLKGLEVWLITNGDELEYATRIKVARKHSPYAKQSSTVGMGSVMIHGDYLELTSEESTHLFQWIELNKDVIYRYWHSEINTQEMISALRKT